jgi:hypothetical protein
VTFPNCRLRGGGVVINLTVLTTPELVLIDVALTAINAALELLLDQGATSEEEGVDLLELEEALAVERDRRTMEDAEHKIGEALARGEVIPVRRPDGQVGYQPRAS